MTINNNLKLYLKENLLKIDNSGIYKAYKLNITKKTLNLKLFFNLEKIRKSKLIEFLEKEYDYPNIILFGSYAKAYDDEKSDIDLCLITESKKGIGLSKFEKQLNRNITLHLFTKNDWKKAVKNNKELINNIYNGITLSGQLEVFL